MFFLRRESSWIIFIILVILVGCWCELDLYAPSFPQMMRYFATTEEMIQWTLSLNFLGFFIASLICGPLADIFGRRKVILGGAIVFAVGSLLCLWAESIEVMLLGRLIQGIGVSGPLTVSQAIIADIYQGEKQVKLLSRTNSVVTVTMALAPVCGVYISECWGWRANFIVIFLLACIGGVLYYLFVPETRPEKAHLTSPLKAIMHGYVRLLTCRDFMMAVGGLCFSITPYFILIGIMPLLFMDQLKVTPHSYAFYQGSVVGLYSILSLLMPRVLARFDITTILWPSIFLAVSGLLGAFVCGLLFSDQPLMITAWMWIYITGNMIPPTLMYVQAMDMFDDIKACASSLIQSLRMLAMAVGTVWAGKAYDGSFKMVALVMLIFMLISIPMTLALFKSKKAMSNRPIQMAH